MKERLPPLWTDDFECSSHVWLPLLGWVGRYRCKRCRGTGYRATAKSQPIELKMDDPNDPQQSARSKAKFKKVKTYIQEYICQTGRCARRATYSSKKHRLCREHAEKKGLV